MAPAIDVGDDAPGVTLDLVCGVPEGVDALGGKPGVPNGVVVLPSSVAGPVDLYVDSRCGAEEVGSVVTEHFRVANGTGYCALARPRGLTRRACRVHGLRVRHPPAIVAFVWPDAGSEVPGRLGGHGRHAGDAPRSRSTSEGAGRKTFCLAGPRGDGARALLEPSAVLTWTVEAKCHSRP